MPARFSDIATFILAGGRSTRMGTDKAFVTLDGKTLLTRMLDLARCVTEDVRIVGDPARFSNFAPVVEDIFPGCGPLGGIHAALRSSEADLNVILAVDIPFLSPEFLKFLIFRSRKSAATVTVVNISGGWQPLCAVYRCAFADVAEEALRAGEYKIGALFNKTETEVISESDLQTAGYSPQIFRNLNTPDDLSANG
jgi:molybdenum cofactor guanylyltransferase